MPDYAFYTDEYLGEDLPREEFDHYLRRASDLLERYRDVFHLTPREGLVRPEDCALCAIAEAMYAFDQEDGRRGFASVSVGSVTETYTAPPELCSTTLALRERYYRALAARYLGLGRYVCREDYYAV